MLGKMYFNGEYTPADYDKAESYKRQELPKAARLLLNQYKIHKTCTHICLDALYLNLIAHSVDCI